MNNRINKRESTTLLNSLNAGVVPRIGLRHIAVGRQAEVNSLLQDLNNVKEGGAAFKFICGKYGSGKSFLIQLIRNNANERSFVVSDVDLSPERRLTGSKGQGISTYRELIKNLSTKTKPDGGALEIILQKWLMTIQKNLVAETGLSLDNQDLISKGFVKIADALSDLSEMTYYFVFTKVIHEYWCAMLSGNDDKKNAALRWIRGEYANITEAKKDLPVDTIIDDPNWYEFVKLFATFVKKVGYEGLIVFIDEGVNLYKISHKQSRESNYEKILTIFNDIMQGKVRYLGFFIGGTPEFIYDERRGLFSYEALRSRLSDNRYASKGFSDYIGPIIKLDKLTIEELYVLLERICDVHSIHYNYEKKLSEKELAFFLQTIMQRLGSEESMTPREISRDFLGLLNVLYQNEEATFEQLVNNKVDEIEIKVNQNNEETVNPFADFKL